MATDGANPPRGAAYLQPVKSGKIAQQLGIGPQAERRDLDVIREDPIDIENNSTQSSEGFAAAGHPAPVVTLVEPVFPAPAGMNPRHPRVALGSGPVPRADGDDPAWNGKARGNRERAPSP